ncbi:MAG: hypothetical protein NC517_11765 [Firmicutes bacterium]|nr:hypothetical protein [Bacillota bacterium]
MKKFKISVLYVCLALLLSACGADRVNAENAEAAAKEAAAASDDGSMKEGVGEDTKNSTGDNSEKSTEENLENGAEENPEKSAENNIKSNGDAADDAPALPDERADAVSDEPSDRYKAVLSGEEDFIAVDFWTGDRNINIKNIKEVVSEEDWVTAEVTKFTIVDMDGDGDNEVVLWIKANSDLDYGFEILYSQEQEIHGFTLPYRGLINLKTDGTFYYSGGIDNSGIGRLQLFERGYVQEEMPDQQHQDEKEDVRWYDLTPEAVELAFENEFAGEN